VFSPDIVTNDGSENSCQALRKIAILEIKKKSFLTQLERQVLLPFETKKFEDFSNFFFFLFQRKFRNPSLSDYFLKTNLLTP
jgi:hypothetical protein